MITQCFTRVARSIPLTLLEVHTLMNAMCAFLMFLLWFHKPQDVMVPMDVRVDEMLKKLQDIVGTNSPDGGDEFILAEVRLSNHGTGCCLLQRSHDRQMFQVIGGFLLGTLYSGVHLIAWKGHFPTNLERILWITSALFVMVIPLLSFPIMLGLWVARGRNGLLNYYANIQFLNQILVNRTIWRKLVFGLVFTLFRLGPSFYLLARLYLFAESFASVRSLPLGSYTAVPWISLIPHF